MSTCQHADPILDAPDDRGERHTLHCHACGQQLVRDNDGTLYEIDPRPPRFPQLAADAERDEVYPRQSEQWYRDEARYAGRYPTGWGI